MRYRFQSGDRVYEVQIERAGEIYRAVIDGQSYEFEVLDAQPGTLSLRMAGRPATIYWAAAPSTSEGGGQWLSADGCTYRLEKPRPKAARGAGDAATGETIRAPMPAQVRAVQVAEGEQVEKGQTLLLLEAMKMEIRVRAPSAGKVARLLAVEGQAVEKEQVLVEMEK